MASDTDTSPAGGGAGDAGGGKRTGGIMRSAVPAGLAGMYKRVRLPGLPGRAEPVGPPTPAKPAAVPSRATLAGLSMRARRAERARRAAQGDPRPVPSVQHQLMCRIVKEYPEVIAELARELGVQIPEGLVPEASVTTYGLPDGTEVYIDVCLLFKDAKGRVRFFLPVEVQLEYDDDKLFTERGYHAAALREHKARGHVLVLSPSEITARAFRDHEVRLREELEFAATYASRSSEVLDRFAAPGRPAGHRLIAMALNDFTVGGVPEGALGLVTELMRDGKHTTAQLLSRLVVENSDNLEELGGAMTVEAAETLMATPVFRDLVEARIAAREAAAMRDNLLAIFSDRGDTPSPDGRLVLAGLTDVETLREWVRRAARGESSAAILRK